MARLVAVSHIPYRAHQIEVIDGGRKQTRVIIHPPGGRGAPYEVTPLQPDQLLAERINHAKALVDAIMGPKPVPQRRAAW
ncbi:MAG: hypothetical protein K2X11_21645 [Acetobacteraceae bacterium]|nr:hypothetical protein [Acetobacteraceae bacterium]